MSQSVINQAEDTPPAAHGTRRWISLQSVRELTFLPAIAGVIIAGLPGALAWALGLLVGIDLVFGGMGLIVMALAAKQA